MKAFLKWTDDLVVEFAKQVVINMTNNDYTKKTMRQRLEIYKKSNGVLLQEVELFEKKGSDVFMKKYTQFVEKNYNNLTIKDVSLLNDFTIFLQENNLLNNE